MKKVFNYIKNNVLSLRTDKIRLIGLVISFALAGVHLYQYHASEFNPQCLYRFCLFIMLCVSSILFSEKAVYVVFATFSLFAVWVNDFNNYTSFFCILLSCRIYRKTEKFLVSLYLLDIIFAYTVRNYEVSHLSIHLLTCAIFYNIYFIINQPKKLNLKSDEKMILDELSDNREMKELECFSVNVAYQKLKDARNRNNILSNEELLERYKQENCNF